MKQNHAKSRVLGFVMSGALHLLTCLACLTLYMDFKLQPPTPLYTSPAVPPRTESAILTAYHSDLCAKGDYKRGKTKSGGSACNEIGVATDWNTLPKGTMIYINDSTMPREKRLRIVDDGCEACEQASLSGELLLDIRHLTLADARRFGRKENVPILIFPTP